MLLRASTILSRQTLSRANKTSQGVSTYRYIHSISQARQISKCNSWLNLYNNCRVTGISLVRYASTQETLSQTNPYNEIPDPPTPIQEITENIVKFHPNGEQTFESLGLGGWTPVGFVQNALEFMHINLDIPWWATIVIGTVIIRSLVFPLVIISQRSMAKLTTHMPVIKELQAKLTEARQMGDHLESARHAAELAKYMKKHNIKFMNNFLVPFVQAPIFISCFFALKGMANLPVDSLKHGGFLWMQDLTIHDPYYLMPIITSVTLYITIELGIDGTNLQAMGFMRYVLRVLPFVAFVFMINFPGAILMYWSSTNFMALLQTSILKVPYIRKSLNIPAIVRHNPQPDSKKKFMVELKESWTNMKITKQIADREQVDIVQFNAAGKGPIIKTFKYDPTKQKEKSTVLAKRR